MVLFIMVLFTKLVEKPSELIFGSAKHPLNYGLGLSVGKGEVIPEVKFFPRFSSDNDPVGFKTEVQTITIEILDRAVELGIPSLQIETELTFMETKNPRLAAEIASLQKSLMEKYFDEHGIKLGFRVTVAYIRGFREGLEQPQTIIS